MSDMIFWPDGLGKGRFAAVFTALDILVSIYPHGSVREKAQPARGVGVRRQAGATESA